MSSWLTRSRARNEAGSSQQPQPTSTPVVPQAYHVEWFPTGQIPRFTPMYHPGWDHTTQPHEARGSRQQVAHNAAWVRLAHSSDFEGLPPPVHPRQSVSDRHGWEDVNTQLGGLEIHTGEIQNTLNTHV